MAGLSVSPPSGHIVPTHRIRGKTRLDPIPEPPEYIGEEPMEVSGERVYEPNANPSDLMPYMEAAPGYIPRVRHRRPAGEPADNERFEHSITHIPYRSWCSICVSARGKSDPHRVTTETRTIAPVVSFDFAFFREGRGTINIPILVGVDKNTGCLEAIALPNKGAFPDWLTHKTARTIRGLATMVR